MFADDAVIYYGGKNQEMVSNKINSDLENMVQWLNKNKLKLNINKTKAMLVGKKLVRNEWVNNGFDIKIQNNVIEIVTEIKYLGVIIVPDLKFDKHVDYICKKISKKIGFLYRVSAFLSKWTRLTIYNTIILPHFLFCSTIIYLSNSDDKKRLQLLQNRAMRIILSHDRYQNIESMLRELNWLPVEQFLEMKSLIFIHKIEKGVMPKYFDNALKKVKNIHNYETRNAENFFVDRKKYLKTQNSIFFKTLNVYNKLPNRFKILKVKKFETEIKKYYMHVNN